MPFSCCRTADVTSGVRQLSGQQVETGESLLNVVDTVGA
jgi:hypothetical protein